MKLISQKGEINRISTNIEGFDESLEGGIPENSIVLMSGTAGTMKSSLCFNIAYKDIIENNSNVLYITLEQNSYSLLNQMITLDFDLTKINIVRISDISKLDENIKNLQGFKNFIVADVIALRKEVENIKKVNPDQDWLYVVQAIIKKIKSQNLCDIIILDSLSSLYVLSQFKDNPRVKLFEFFEFLREIDATSIMISEVPAENPGAYGEFGIEDYLADGVIFLDKKRQGLSVRRELSVAKMRWTNANMDIFILNFENGKFRALTKLLD